jgi:hypothetical protein
MVVVTLSVVMDVMVVVHTAVMAVMAAEMDVMVGAIGVIMTVVLQRVVTVAVALLLASLTPHAKSAQNMATPQMNVGGVTRTATMMKMTPVLRRVPTVLTPTGT